MQPELLEAWKNQEAVILHFDAATPVTESAEARKLAARVSRVDTNHRGRVVLHENIVRRECSPLTSAEFSIVNFPDFFTWRRPRESVKQGGDGSINFIPVGHSMVLIGDDGWTITVARDNEKTRGWISHTGLIEKRGHDGFDEVELCKVLELLKYFFAFTMGSYCLNTAVVGYGADDGPVWGQVGKFEDNQRREIN